MWQYSGRGGRCGSYVLNCVFVATMSHDSVKFADSFSVRNLTVDAKNLSK